MCNEHPSLHPKSTSSGWLHHPSGRGVAWQSHAMESATWRLPRHFVPRNDVQIRDSPGCLNDWNTTGVSVTSRAYLY
jgi:hypothetical protein